MITLHEQITLDEVIMGLLRSSCFTEDKDTLDPRIPDTPQERYRALVGRCHLFLRFLPHCDWYHGVIDTAECLEAIQLINEESWFPDETGRDRSLKRWAHLDGLPSKHAERVNDILHTGLVPQCMHRRVTLFSHAAEGPYTILDGNHRLLAMAHRVLHHGDRLGPLSVHLGIGLGPCRWHGDSVAWEERPPIHGTSRFVLRVW